VIASGWVQWPASETCSLALEILTRADAGKLVKLAESEPADELDASLLPPPYLAASLANLLRVAHSLAGGDQQTAALNKALARYCCYDHKKKRRNFTEPWENLA